MAKLIYTAITSLDGYVADAEGNFDWSMPDAEVHAFINDLERGIGTQLMGRKLYEVMIFWEPLYGQTDLPPFIEDFATIWHDADKIVYSKTLRETESKRTRIESTFDPAEVERMKTQETADLSVGGADLAGQALNAGLVDEIHFFVSPVVVGGGKRALPHDIRLNLALLGQRAFPNGVTHLHYQVLKGDPDSGPVAEAEA
ncbi:dihydrofolate reductase family protein [Paeniglutamicibacter sp. NPDC091659]|uniref:dihydrofolate reductase family protein n=1 Tax=Paeniglutamicibacter sp. NPDC091659 TaxID=3364389 RepID=UPI00381F0A06